MHEITKLLVDATKSGTLRWTELYTRLFRGEFVEQPNISVVVDLSGRMNGTIRLLRRREYNTPMYQSDWVITDTFMVLSSSDTLDVLQAICEHSANNKVFEPSEQVVEQFRQFFNLTNKE